MQPTHHLTFLVLAWRELDIPYSLLTEQMIIILDGDVETCIFMPKLVHPSQIFLHMYKQHILYTNTSVHVNAQSLYCAELKMLKENETKMWTVGGKVLFFVCCVLLVCFP